MTPGGRCDHCDTHVQRTGQCDHCQGSFCRHHVAVDDHNCEADDSNLPLIGGSALLAGVGHVLVSASDELVPLLIRNWEDLLRLVDEFVTPITEAGEIGWQVFDEIPIFGPKDLYDMLMNDSTSRIVVVTLFLIGLARTYRKRRKAT